MKHLAWLALLIAGCATSTVTPTVDWSTAVPASAQSVPLETPAGDEVQMVERERVAHQWLSLHPKRLQRFVAYVDQDIYDYVKMRLQNNERPIEIIQRDGREALVLYGCVLTTP